MNRKKIMAICDTEGAYACRLMEYMDEEHSLPYEIHAFTAPEKLCEFAAKKDIDVLLVSEAALTEQVEGLPAETRIVLTEEETGETEYELRLCKYLGAGEILEKVAGYSDAGPPVPTRYARAGNCSIFGVYAPSGGIRATTLAAALSAVLSETEKTLYINLRPFCGIDSLTGEYSDCTISDLLYYCRQDAKDLKGLAGGMIAQSGRVSFIAPPSSPADLQEVDGAEWAEAISLLIEAGDFSVCVLEFSDGVRDLHRMFGICDRVFICTGSSAAEEAALGQFRAWLRDADRADVSAKCMIIYPPSADDVEAGDLFRSAASGAYGHVARQALAGRRTDDETDAGIPGKADGPLGRMRRAFRRRDPGAD